MPARGCSAFPGGSIVLGLVGLGIGITGIAFVVMGVQRTSATRSTFPSTASAAAWRDSASSDSSRRGSRSSSWAILLLVAAVTIDADAAGGLDGAFVALLALAYGPLLVGAVGAGFIAYGLFCLFRARFARLSPT